VTSDDTVIPLSRIVIIDLEASGLGSVSYPTEIGWAMINDDGSITSGACLISPAAKWTTYGNAWSAASERLTGITREMLDRDGVSPREAVERFLEALKPRDGTGSSPESEAPGYPLDEQTRNDDGGKRSSEDTASA